MKLRKIVILSMINVSFALTAYNNLDDLPYDIFNSPNIIEISGTDFRIWSTSNYIDSEKIVVENWAEAIHKEPTEKEIYLRLVINYNNSDNYWDSGFIYGHLDLKYYEELQKVVILQRLMNWLEGESFEEAFSYLLDIKSSTLYKFLHRRPALECEIIDSEIILLNYEFWNNNTDEYETRKMIINPEDLIKVK